MNGNEYRPCLKRCVRMPDKQSIALNMRAENWNHGSRKNLWRDAEAITNLYLAQPRRRRP